MVLLVYAITQRYIQIYLGFLPFLLVFVLIFGELGLLLFELKLGRELELLITGLLLLLFLIIGLLLLIVGFHILLFLGGLLIIGGLLTTTGFVFGSTRGLELLRII